MPEGELLETLADRAGCYISSLREPSQRKKLFRILLEAGAKRYSLKEWEYTVGYLTGRSLVFADCAQVDRFLRENAG